MDNGLSGIWQGIADLNGQPLRVALELGAEQSFIHCSEAGLVYVPVDVQAVKDRTEINSSLMKLFVKEEGETLVGQVESAWIAAKPITFRRNHPDFAALETPRIDTQNRPTTDYAYAQPVQHEDGWQTATASSCDVSEQALETIVSRVLTGNEGCIVSALRSTSMNSS